MRLYVSINSPSHEMAKSPIDDAITFVAKHAAVENRHGHFPTGPALDITFMLASKDDVPPFSGMRMGCYSREGGTLFFEAAVPADVTQSGQAPHYVAMVMQNMVDNAKNYFDELGIEFDSYTWQQMMENMTRLEASATALQ